METKNTFHRHSSVARSIKPCQHVPAISVEKCCSQSITTLAAMWARVETAEYAQKGMRNTEVEAVREWDEIGWLSGMYHQTSQQ